MKPTVLIKTPHGVDDFNGCTLHFERDTVFVDDGMWDIYIRDEGNWGIVVIGLRCQQATTDWETYKMDLNYVSIAGGAEEFREFVRLMFEATVAWFTTQAMFRASEITTNYAAMNVKMSRSKETFEWGDIVYKTHTEEAGD